MTIFNADELVLFYGSRSGNMIPLHAWDAIDQHGRERGKSPRDVQWTTRSYEPFDIHGAISEGRNIGFRMGPADLVLDFDPRSMDRSLEDAISYLEERFSFSLADAPTVTTGSGGLHIYMELPQEYLGCKFRNEMPELPGVEHKCFGKQVVASGSKHPCGGMYTSTKGSMDSPVLMPDTYLGALEVVAKSSDCDATVSNGRLSDMLAYLDPSDFASNDSWIQLAMACHAATGGEGREEFVEWSVSDSEYSGQEETIRMRWDSFKGGGITAATLFKVVSEAGGSELLRDEPEQAFGSAEFSEQDQAILSAPPRFTAPVGGPDTDGLFDREKSGRPKRTLENCMKAIEAMGLEPALNALSQEVSLGGDLSKARKYFPEINKSITDLTLHGLRRAIISDYMFEPSLQQVSEAISCLAVPHSFHPIKSYLSDLVWDGEDRITEFFHRYAGGEKGAYNAGVAEMFFRASVARVKEPGIKFDSMIILEGAQGCGKSTLIKVLGGDWTLEGLPSTNSMDNKDVIQAIQGHWLVEVEELAVMSKSDVESIKAFVSRTTDKARFAYARESREYRRQCVFIGTTNDAEYLLDSTGNRRFIPVEVNSVALAELRRDRDQIWAQAVQLWLANPTVESLFLKESLWAEAGEQQELRRIADPIEFKLLGHLRQIEPEVDFIGQEELVFVAFGKVDGSSIQTKDMRRLGRAMQTIDGWTAARRRTDGRVSKGFRRVT
jgi:predicted P-loop ATPase